MCQIWANNVYIIVICTNPKKWIDGLEITNGLSKNGQK